MAYIRKTPTKEEKERQVAELAKNPVLKPSGVVNISQTLIQGGFNGNSYNLQRLLISLLPENVRKMPKNEVNLVHTGCDGLKISDETISKYTSAELKKPAIFKITHIPSGRYLISGSSKPHLQRSVLFYWMKNWFTYSTANTFFGNSKFIKDFQKDGPNAFEYSIIETFEFIERDVLNKMTRDLIKSCKDDIYNIINEPNLTKHFNDCFYTVDVEMRNAVNDLRKYYNKFQKIEEPNKLRRKQIIEEKAAIEYKAKKDPKLANKMKKLSAEYLDLKFELKQMVSCIKMREHYCRNLHLRLVEKYSKNTKPYKLI